ncbi:uncharacterized protein BO97DRAFT_417314 [Aspergillus homomorphus CBS 101889]|uniref:Uncharacterized protein n=1 Tax=Aspergillus homomorphus (strain CBS 101889) TaxID=1450537 RepID=A0A395HLW6_ASPHC|nr:hypothetical protein BO97DRAFT_417314 [Aspergillus homomorphus CBS 101889]RAL08847.1 hypothetical protein BO97DRAFT_417314 [Aspergillus homomorphus CBS 101889]
MEYIVAPIAEMRFASIANRWIIRVITDVAEECWRRRAPAMPCVSAVLPASTTTISNGTAHGAGMNASAMGTLFSQRGAAVTAVNTDVLDPASVISTPVIVEMVKLVKRPGAGHPVANGKLADDATSDIPITVASTETHRRRGKSVGFFRVKPPWRAAARAAECNPVPTVHLTASEIVDAPSVGTEDLSGSTDVTQATAPGAFNHLNHYGDLGEVNRPVGRVHPKVE